MADEFTASLFRVRWRYRMQLVDAVEHAVSNAERLSAKTALERWDREYPELVPQIPTAYASPQLPTASPQLPRQATGLEGLSYGAATLPDDLSAQDPISLDTVDPDQAVYLEPNVVGGKATQLYDYAQIEKLLRQGSARSPMSRRPFARGDVKRVNRAAVESIIARM